MTEILRAVSKQVYGKVALKVHPFGNTAFLADEIFVGFGMQLTKNLRAELYYMLVSAKSSGAWKDSQVLGSKIKVSF